MRKLQLGIVVLILLSLSVTGVLAQGGNLTYGSASLGTISPEAPLAFYTFNGTAGDQINVRVTAITPGFDPALSVLSPTQQQVAQNDNDPFVSGSTDAVISARLNATGPHILLVAGSAGSTGDFLLRLDGSPSTPGTPIDSTAPSSIPLAPGSAPQVFAFTVAPNVLTTVSVQPTPSDFPFSAELRNATSGQLLGILNQYVQQLTIGAGSYEVVITATDPSATGSVDLSLVDTPVEADGETPPQQPPPQQQQPPPQQQQEQPPSDQSAPAETPEADAPADQAVPAVTSEAAPPESAESSSETGESSPTPTVTATTESPPELVLTEEVFACSVSIPDGTSVYQSLDPGAASLAYAAGPDGNRAYPGVEQSADGMWYGVNIDGAVLYVSVSAVTTEGDCANLPTPGGAPTATYTPSYTPTLSDGQPSATYTPSYTPTATQPAQIAPDDGNFGAQLDVPLDSTVSVLDFVSYPGGDVEDRAFWDVTGMNPSVAITGGRARLTISASCFGTGTEYIEFEVGGQVFYCGNVIVDREVTFDQKTGLITIRAVGGEGTYVQWVLTGTATRDPQDDINAPQPEPPDIPTATYTPSYTPTASATTGFQLDQDTDDQPTATYTPSYTPTATQPAQIAPDDGNFGAQLDVPLDSTVSVLDFVSYPGGDVEDRAFWDVTGMNPSVAITGGRARLTISATCFGTGTQYIEFEVGGQIFYCGNVIVDREVTFDQKTGLITIRAVGGEGTYVQWVLTGTAIRDPQGDINAPQPEQQIIPSATYTPSYTPTLQDSIDAVPDGELPTATYTYTPTLQDSIDAVPDGEQPTATYTPSYTPTATTGPPTATYTPSYTPTATTSTAQLAPEDARFNNPLNIALDNTASVLDFVSYPGGDTEDRVSWDVTGMNQNVSITGGQARLVISASCFGQNTDQIQFFTGGQTYTCGQTIVDRDITANQRTGSIVITAVGGEGTYVQWVLTGTATRTN